jgi:glucokinase
MTPQARPRRAVAGVDVGGTKIQVAILDRRLKVLGDGRRPTPRNQGGRALVEAIAAAVGDAVEAAGAIRLGGAGLGLPGAISDDGRMPHSANMKGLPVPYPVGREVADLLGVPVIADNDVHMGLLGEEARGVARGRRHVLAVWLGTGIGGGVLVAGRLVRGASGGAGEIGHITVRPEGRRCGCGRLGCLEAYAGRASLVEAARTAAAASGETSRIDAIAAKRGRELITSSVVAQALAEGDPVMSGLLDEAVEALGQGIGSLVNVLDPELIVLGGGFGCRLGMPFAARVEAALRPHTLASDDGYGHTHPVVVSALGDLAGATGAASEAWRALADPRESRLLRPGASRRSAQRA